MALNRVTHVITTLDVGGAELVLHRLLSAGRRAEGGDRVVSLTTLGEVGRRMRAQGIDVQSLDGPSHSSPRHLVQLATILRAQQPDVVQTWMYHADLVGGVAARLARVPIVVWNLRTGYIPGVELPLQTRWAPRVLARLSHRLPDAIVCGSHAALEIHEKQGYDRTKLVVIPNGFTIPQSEPGLRAEVRHEFGIPLESPVVGIVGRWHPQKDHRTFVEAAGMVGRGDESCWFVVVGPGVDNPALRAWLEEAGVADRTVVCGYRSDVGRLTAAFDIACSSSWTEGLSNTLGEAMAQGIPVVATDVGDSRRLVGEAGLVVSPRDPSALAGAISLLLEAGPAARSAMGALGRERITEHYSVESMASAYDHLYRDLLGRVRNSRLPR